MVEEIGPKLGDRLEQSPRPRHAALPRYAQDQRGAWQIEPDPRIFDTGLVAYVLSRVDRPDVQAAVARALSMAHPLRSAGPRHSTRASSRRRRAGFHRLGRGASIDLRDPALYSNVLRRKTLHLYVLALHAGVEVLSPYTPEQIKEQVRRGVLHLRSGSITMKRWSQEADLISIYADFGRAWTATWGRPRGRASTSARMRRSTTAAYFHTTRVSTAIAFLALSGRRPSARPRRHSCLDHLLAAQHEDGTWRFTTCDVWDTTLMLGGPTETTLASSPRRRRRTTRFVMESQNPDAVAGGTAPASSPTTTPARVRSSRSAPRRTRTWRHASSVG